jgi:tetratricopeptide (TPR) repeat protein
MDSLIGVNADALFSATVPKQQQMDELSKQSLSRGIDLYIAEDYRGAIREFGRSLGLAPYSEYSVDASNYMATAYLQLDETEKAISTYKNSIRLNPTRDDIHITLGNLYFSLDRHEDAEREYKEAVRKYPSANNYFALGQANLYLDRFGEAEAAFVKVRSLDPKKATGDYGLGLTYSKQGIYAKAIDHFEKAIRLDKDFYDGYAEIGYAYADMGEIDEAKAILEFLEQKDPALANTLSQYIYQVDKPNFSTVYYPEAFGSYPAKTPISSLDVYLANANASKTFTISISFDKEMDRESVESLANWQISRASGSGPGEAYNFGLPVPSTEVKLPSIPINVYYDSETWTAKVKFTVTQNETADGTIHPSHIAFKFLGKDSYGNKMDSGGDQYSTFSGVA